MIKTNFSRPSALALLIDVKKISLEVSKIGRRKKLEKDYMNVLLRTTLKKSQKITSSENNVCLSQ